MPTAKVTTKGQVTIPRAVREAMGIEAGDHVQFLVREDGVVELFPRTRPLLSLAGLLARPSAPVTSVEEMDAGIAEAVCDEYDRATR